MPTPTNYNNILYSRQYRIVLKDTVLAEETTVKGSIDYSVLRSEPMDNLLPSPNLLSSVGQNDYEDK